MSTLFVLLQYIVPQHLISYLAGKLADGRLFKNQRASWRLSRRNVLSALLSARLTSPAYPALIRSRGVVSGLSSTDQRPSLLADRTIVV